MTDDQARRLHDRAAELGDGTQIVEIGSFRGRSMIVLASTASDGVAITAIDPHMGSDRGPQEIEADQVRGDDDYARKRDIVAQAATDAGRDPSDIECCVTVGGDLPESDADSEAWRERLEHMVGRGVSYFVMDFGHPLDPEPAVRFAEQVIAPMRAT